MKSVANSPKITAFSREYTRALREYLRGRGADLKQAQGLGQKAVSLNLDTLELAKLHQKILPLVPPGEHSTMAVGKKAQSFFNEVNAEIERTRPAATEVKVKWREINRALKERTSELRVSKKDVKKRIGQRRVAEAALKSRNRYYENLLKESLSLQDNLRAMAHRVLLAQENKRGHISRELHDETAQALLGINVRLLTLQKQSARDAKWLLREIASTQRLVNRSVIALRRAKRRHRDE